MCGRPMFVKFALRTAAVLLVVGTHATSAADGPLPFVDELRVGASTPANGDFQVLFSPVPAIGLPYDRNLTWLFTPRPMAGMSVSLNGKTSIAYGGLTWTLPIYGRFFAEVSVGGLVHNQNLNQTYGDRPSPLSTRILFRESIAIGYRIDDYWRVVAFADHGSNGDLGYRNASLNHYGVMIGRKLSPTPDKPSQVDSDLAGFSWSGPYAGFGVALARGNYNLLSPTPTDVT